MVPGPEEDELPGDEHRESELPPRPSAAPAEREHVHRGRLERMLPELIRRGLEKGLEAGLGTLQTLSKTEESVRGAVTDGKLPREVAGYVFAAIEDTKNGMLRVVAREVREFLEATDLATEMQKALTTLSFEIKTEIRFVPNEAGTGVRPEVKAGRTSVKRKTTDEPADPAAPPVTPEPAAAPPEESRSLLRRRSRPRRSKE